MSEVPLLCWDAKGFYCDELAAALGTQKAVNSIRYI